MFRTLSRCMRRGSYLRNTVFVTVLCYCMVHSIKIAMGGNLIRLSRSERAVPLLSTTGDEMHRGASFYETSLTNRAHRKLDSTNNRLTNKSSIQAIRELNNVVEAFDLAREMGLDKTPDGPGKPVQTNRKMKKPWSLVKLSQELELDFSQLDLLSLEDELEGPPLPVKETGDEEKLRYTWREKESDPVQSRPPSFQPIREGDLWVYSAFYVPPGKYQAVVKGLGLVSRNLSKSHPTLFCQIFKGSEEIEVSRGKISVIPEDHGLKFLATWLECPLSESTVGTHPDGVTFKIEKGDTSTNKVPLTYPGTKMLRNFTVCHPVIYGPFDWPSQLIHVWEMHRLLGAEHFYLYNLNASYATERVLIAYEKVGLLTVLPWDDYPANLGHYRSQLLAVNDCVYRNRNVSRYVLIQDVDEIVVPTEFRNWWDLLKTYDGKKVRKWKQIGSFAVQSSYFVTSPGPDAWKTLRRQFNISQQEEKQMKHYEVKPFTNLVRDDNVFKYPKHSKNIVRPEKICTMGVHTVWCFAEGYGFDVIPADKAILYHFKKRKHIDKSWAPDSRILKLHKSYFERLKVIYKQIDLFWGA